METPGFQILLENLKQMFIIECKKLSDMGKETSNNVNEIKKDNIIIKNRLDKLEKMMEGQQERSENRSLFTEPNKVGKLSKSSSLNNFEEKALSSKIHYRITCCIKEICWCFT